MASALQMLYPALRVVWTLKEHQSHAAGDNDELVLTGERKAISISDPGFTRKTPMLLSSPRE